ncbi:MAG: type II toxin-antitoxin system death-on-curing family toxin [Candidatus Bathyarchaeota archaeon]|nr:type II toxin-antitoxin system death-on-curing family toxin [Candidatus Bathyarchaeota archaeon]
MTTKITKVKPNKKALEQHIEIPDYQISEDEIWYPPDEFVVVTHDLMIQRYGGYTGFETGLNPYYHFLEEVKKAQDIYMKAAILLHSIATSRIFQDGHHRTAFEVTKAFLEVNGAGVKEKDEQKTIKFIKGIRNYQIEEVARWLKDGTK